MCSIPGAVAPSTVESPGLGKLFMRFGEACLGKRLWQQNSPAAPKNSTAVRREEFKLQEFRSQELQEFRR